MTPLGISVDGFPNDKKVALFEFGNFLLDIYIFTQKIDGFPGTHGTQANGATGLVWTSWMERQTFLWKYYFRCAWLSSC